MLAKGFASFAVLLLVLAGAGSAAQAKPRSGKIDMGKGIAGVNLNLQRGPGPGRRPPRTVASLLGKPNSLSSLPRIGQTEGEKSVYLAVYKDDGLAVYFSKRDARNRIDTKRDRFDRVIGVTTYSSRFTGTYSVGKPLSPAEDGECAPLDARNGAGGGPRRVSACPVEVPDRAFDVIYLSGGDGSRASQRIQQVSVFKSLLGQVTFQSLVDGALEDLGCTDLACTARG